MTTQTLPPATDSVVPRTVTTGASRRRSRFRIARGNGAHYLLLSPALLLSLAIVLIPGIFTAVIAFTNFNGINFNVQWVGFSNFAAIFTDPVFWQALGHNVTWTLLFLTVPVVLGMGTALLLLKRRRVRTVYQVLFLLPYVLAAITNAIVWLNIIYSPTSGVIGYLENLGLNLPAPLSNTNTALFAVAGVDMWHYWGFLTLVYLAALRQTPVEQVEAALLEGASGVQIFRYVYLPNIKATVQLMFVMIIIFSFLAFDYVYLMTQGGPAHSTEMLSTYAYTFAFSTFEFGKAAAVGLVMSLFGLIASVIFTVISRRDVRA